MSTRDPHTHAPKNVIITHETLGAIVTDVTGLRAPDPRTVATACGKRRAYSDVVGANPETVTCEACRRDAARQHAEQADHTEAALKLVDDGIVMMSSVDDIRSMRVYLPWFSRVEVKVIESRNAATYLPEGVSGDDAEAVATFYEAFYGAIVEAEAAD